jgi:hypothetical protein
MKEVVSLFERCNLAVTGKGYLSPRPSLEPTTSVSKMAKQVYLATHVFVPSFRRTIYVEERKKGVNPSKA